MNCAQAYARTHGRTDACSHARTDGRTHARTHARTHGRTDACSHALAHAHPAANHGTEHPVRAARKLSARCAWRRTVMSFLLMV
jgi:hypothetical protein